MIYRINEFDSIAIALLLRKKYCGNDMLSLDKGKEYNEIINVNLEQMKSSSSIILKQDKHYKLYDLFSDENEKIYAVIKEEADLKWAWEYYLEWLPFDIMLAATKENAFDAIGLQALSNKTVGITKKKLVK